MFFQNTIVLTYWSSQSCWSFTLYEFSGIQYRITVLYTIKQMRTQIKWIITLKDVKYCLEHSISPRSGCFNFTSRLPLGRREDKRSHPILYSPKVSVRIPFLLQRTQLAKTKCTLTSLLWILAPGSFFQSGAPLSCC